MKLGTSRYGDSTRKGRLPLVSLLAPASPSGPLSISTYVVALKSSFAGVSTI